MANLIRRVGGRVRVPVSPVGWSVLVVAVVLEVVGWWRGWVELIAIATSGLFVLVLAAVMTVGRSTYEVDLQMSDHRVSVGDRAVGRVVVANTARRRVFAAVMELPVGRGSADFLLPSLGPGGTHEEVFAVPTTRRAVVTVGPVRSARGDPLGLVRRRLEWTGGVDLYVHPKVVGLGGATPGVLRDLEGQSTRTISDSDLSFHALRDYVAGDDRRHIHWRSTARTNRLMVRQFEDTRRSHTTVALATAPGDYADPAEFEIAVSVVASLGVQVLREKRGLTVLAGAGGLRVDTPVRLLDDLSGLELGSGTRDVCALARWVAREAPSTTLAVLVAGSVPGRVALRASVTRIAAGVRIVAVLVDPAGQTEVIRHERLSVARIASLVDLPEALGRVGL